MENAISVNSGMNLFDNGATYCSLAVNTAADKAVLYRAMANPDKRLSDHIGETIYAKDVFVEMVQLTNEQTGELVSTPRIVIIDKDGVSYQCVSYGVFNAMKRIFSVFGEPTWAEPMPLTVKQAGKGTRKVLTLDVNF